jgi:hypothetical protein
MSRLTKIHRQQSSDVASAAVDWSEMSGSSSSSPPRGAEVLSSRQLPMAARDKKVGSSSRQAASPAQEGQRAVRPRVAPSGTGTPESQRTAPRQADPPRRSEERPASTRQLYDGSDRPDSDSLQRRRPRWKSSDSASMPSVPQAGGLAPPRGACSHYLSGGRSRRRPCFPRRRRGPRTNSDCRRGRGVSPRADGGASSRRRGGGPKRCSPRVGGPEAHSSRTGLVEPPGEEAPGALQDVSPRHRIFYRRFSNLLCSLTLLLSFRSYADTGVLSLAPLKCLALSARVVPSEPRSQPPRVGPLPAQAEEGPVVVAAVEEPSTPPPRVAAITVEEG